MWTTTVQSTETKKKKNQKDAFAEYGGLCL